MHRYRPTLRMKVWNYNLRVSAKHTCNWWEEGAGRARECLRGGEETLFSKQRFQWCYNQRSEMPKGKEDWLVAGKRVEVWFRRGLKEDDADGRWREAGRSVSREGGERWQGKEIFTSVLCMTVGGGGGMYSRQCSRGDENVTWRNEGKS